MIWDRVSLPKLSSSLDGWEGPNHLFPLFLIDYNFLANVGLPSRLRTLVSSTYRPWVTLIGPQTF